MVFNRLKTAEPPREDSLLFTTKSENSWYSFDRPRKDEKMSQP